MALRDIVKDGSTILRKKCREVESFRPILKWSIP